ncbi:LLM class flavin-dependent oxidoreductase [Sphaerisporangium viridialbum]|uniref:LLM class flavin-dependent oxidoreductase n=1 Tax=Sphaerisporangium viridialbum TaxID=46189 RepID=UPI003C73F64E
MSGHLRFGSFMPPYHSPLNNHALAIERDLETVELLDGLGYDDVWFGEHHSGGYECSPMPELMIAAAAQRTRRIRLGTGVISLPYHHPLMVADRMVFLDHMTRGRCIFGVGPGALVADSQMMGIDYGDLRPRMEESLEAILELLTSPEPVTRKAEWFELRDAQLHVRSHTRPMVPIAVAGAVSPTGPKLAGRHGLSLLSFGAASTVGFNKLAGTWEIVEAEAAASGARVEREDWALVGYMHVAETERQARDEVRYQIRSFFDYHHTVAPPLLADVETMTHDELIDGINASGAGIVGTPDMAVAHLRKLVDRTGGFGTFLISSVDWANREATRRSLELFAREVIPHFDGSIPARAAAFARAKARQVADGRLRDAGREKATAAYNVAATAIGQPDRGTVS